jgi:hypothetical protein
MAMNYYTEIRSLMDEEHKLHVAAETHKKECGRDREYLLLRIERDQIAAHEDELRRQAAQEFAALNGWHWTKRAFLARTLARGGTHDGRWVYDELTDGQLHHDLFDHPVFFREIARPYRAVAIVVGQPYYTSTTLAEVRAIAAKIGLALHTPPELNGELVVSRLDAVLCFHAPRAGVRAIPARAIGKAGD